jgi:hypothetical protein
MSFAAPLNWEQSLRIDFDKPFVAERGCDFNVWRKRTPFRSRHKHGRGIVSYAQIGNLEDAAHDITAAISAETTKIGMEIGQKAMSSSFGHLKPPNASATYSAVERAPDRYR